MTPKSKRIALIVTIVGVVTVAVAAALGVGLGLGLKKYNQPFTYSKPPVVQSTPYGLKAISGTNKRQLDPTSIKQRFFTDGPMFIFGILDSIDGRLQDYNPHFYGHGCSKTNPVGYTLNFGGNSVQMYGQCYDNINGGGFVQIGLQNNVTYLYQVIGDSEIAAIVQPPAPGATGDTLNNTQVRVYYSVGIQNTCGSRAVASIYSFNGNMELSGAGNGIGMCGFQFVSNGQTIYLIGSSDGPGCAAADTLCVLASDALTVTTCTDTTFTLPAIGRVASTWPNYATTCPNGPSPNNGTSQTFAASAYPGGSQNSIVIDGLSTDSVYFGPSSPTPGLGSW